MTTSKKSILVFDQKTRTRRSLWLGGTAIGLLLLAQPISAQTTTPDLRSTSSAQLPIDGTVQPEAKLAPVTPLANTDPAADGIQQLPENFVAAENAAVAPIDNEEFEARTGDTNGPPGIRLGTMVLRPTISQGINHQREKRDGDHFSRSYLTTSARGTLESDWSRHALTVIGEGRIERNLGGTDIDEQPQANIDADLRLDLGGDIEAHVLGGYRVEKEDVNSPNAIGGVESQGTEHRFNLGGSVQREFGTLRGLAAVDLSRTTYDDAKDFSGASISLKDRDRNEAMVRARLGYEISPALIPFLELHGGVTRYDQRFDSVGYQRSSRTVGAKLGAEINRGEKFNGELSIGYITRSYDDARLASLGALSFDALANWSPKRGTDVTLGLRTTFDDFAGGTEGGWANYQIRTGLTHQIRSDLIGRLTAQAEYRGTQNVTEYQAGAGLTYSMNRYVDLTADATYKLTPRYKGSDFIVGAGISLKR